MLIDLAPSAIAASCAVKTRHAYVAALQAADGGNSRPLIAFARS